jgi:WhiB family transcriptional regulator, redox-sensing transcriptional regulator
VSRPVGDVGGWLPVKGRPVVCRRGGCSQLATEPDVGLCAAHDRLRATPGPDSRAKVGEAPQRLRGPPAWAHLAACRDAAGVDFYAEGKNKAVQREIERARAVCRACPVDLSCLEAGLQEKFGLWGGLTPVERRRLRKTGKPAA